MQTPLHKLRSPKGHSQSHCWGSGRGSRGPGPGPGGREGVVWLGPRRGGGQCPGTQRRRGDKADPAHVGEGDLGQGFPYIFNYLSFFPYKTPPSSRHSVNVC